MTVKWLGNRSALLVRRTDALLVGLGSTADEVEASLKDAGVTGVPRSETGCAIAAYLSAVVGAEPSVDGLRVSSSAVTIKRHWHWLGSSVVELPEPVRGFICGFDANAYPELCRSESAERVFP